MPLTKARSLTSLATGEFNLRGDSSKFVVVFDDSQWDLGAWSRVTGLSVQWDQLEVRTGDTNVIWTAPGQPKYTKISLSRATCFDSETVQDWLVETSRNPKVYSGKITLLTWAGVPLISWTLGSFVPIGWKIADFETKASTVVMETLDLAHTGFLNDQFDLSKPAAGRPRSNAVSAGSGGGRPRR